MMYREIPPKCEFCGRFGAYKKKWTDPRGPNTYTLELCQRCWTAQDKWALELDAKERHDKYMDGWDNALIAPSNRGVFAVSHDAIWLAGFDDCVKGKPLPTWYAEWKEEKKIKI